MSQNPADLQFAAQTLSSISTRAKRVSSALDPTGAKLKPMAGAVTALIAGTASGTDAELRSMVLMAERSLKDAQWALQLAAKQAADVAARAMDTRRRSQSGR